MSRYNMLKTERSTWLESWRELAQYIKPKSYRYLQNETNKGWRKDQSIINNTATKALRRATAGMMTGITPTSRPWFNLTLPDTDLADHPAVRDYLDLLVDVVRKVLAGSNIYRGLHKTYEGLLLMSTAVLFIDNDARNLVRAYDFPIGQFCLANSDRLEVDTCIREYRMTPAQMVKKFGADKVSDRIKSAYETKSGTENWADILHIVEPNADYKPGQLGPGGMPWRSCWMELGGDETKPFLREAGYYENPVLAARWDTTGEDVYGNGPGGECIGDVRALQELEREKGRLVEKIVDPPMVGPMAMVNQRTSILPGEMNYVDSITQGQSFRPAMEVNPSAIQVVEASIREHELRIKEGFFEDLWMMMQEGESPQQTAREVAEKHEEKLTQLGPVLENLDRELLSPLIERVVSAVLRQPGLMPKPPPELQGHQLSIEYISIVAQAQKMVAVSGIERLSAFVGSWAATRPDILDKVNLDNFVDEYAQSIGVKANLIIPTEQAQKLRAARTAAQQQQAQQQQAMAAAMAAKTLSQADTGGDNALTRLMQGIPTAAGGS